ncbi:MAG: hypothetical protein AAGG48_31950 [Planctomycetota bacterium]
MNLRFLLTAVAHAALTCAFLAAPSRWMAAVVWTWLVATVAFSFCKVVLEFPTRRAFHLAYATVATVMFFATGLNGHGSTYWLPTVVYDYYRPQRWDIDFDGVTGASERMLVEVLYRQDRDRVATAALSIPFVGGAIGLAASSLHRYRER